MYLFIFRKIDVFFELRIFPSFLIPFSGKPESSGRAEPVQEDS